MNSVARSKRRECAKRVIAVVLIVVEESVKRERLWLKSVAKSECEKKE